MKSLILRTNRSNEFSSFKKLIEVSNEIVITSHQNPDADAIGSAVGMHLYLQSIGKQSTILFTDSAPYNLSFIDSFSDIKLYSHNEHFAFLQTIDLCIVLDVNTRTRLKQLGEDLAIVNPTLILIDHHQDPTIQPTLGIVDTDSPSTCELIYTLLVHDESFSPSKELASALYSGIYMDTGGFRFPRTDAETLLIAAELIHFGADPILIYDSIINTAPLGRSQLVGRAFTSMKLCYDNRVCILSISKKDMEETNTTLEHTNGIVATILEISGMRLGVLLIEDNDRIKISFRSKNNFPANKLANEFNGGGHFYAAGGSLPATFSLSNAGDKVAEAVEKFSKYL